MSIAEEMQAKLTLAFAPDRLEITDDSEKHRGHAGWREGGETHFTVTIAAAAFADMTRLERHRAVHAALTPELVGRIHALALNISG